MAEEAKKKPEAAPPAAGGHGDKGAAAGGEHKEAGKGGGGGGLLAKTPVLIGGVMIIEAAVLFAGFKFLGAAPKPAPAADLATEDGSAAGGDAHDAAASDAHGGGGHDAGGDGKPVKINPKKPIEIPVVTEFRAPNKLSGRTIIYDVVIVAATKGMYKEKVETAIKEREGLLKDRIRTIIAECEPEKLSEPGLETLRRNVKYRLDEIVGPDIIDEVLVPRCIPFRSDY